MGKQYAYIRVSSKEQNEERQRSAMREYGVPAENIILDKQSGKDFERQGRPARRKDFCILLRGVKDRAIR